MGSHSDRHIEAKRDPSRAPRHLLEVGGALATWSNLKSTPLRHQDLRDEGFLFQNWVSLSDKYLWLDELYELWRYIWGYLGSPVLRRPQVELGLHIPIEAPFWSFLQVMLVRIYGYLWYDWVCNWVCTRYKSMRLDDSFPGFADLCWSNHHACCLDHHFAVVFHTIHTTFGILTMRIAPSPWPGPLGPLGHHTQSARRVPAGSRRETLLAVFERRRQQPRRWEGRIVRWHLSVPMWVKQCHVYHPPRNPQSSAFL